MRARAGDGALPEPLALAVDSSSVLRTYGIGVGFGQLSPAVGVVSVTRRP